MTDSTNRQLRHAGWITLNVAVLVFGLLLSQPNKALAQVTGSGTINKIPKWTATIAIGDSVIAESSKHIGIGTTTPGRVLDIVSPGVIIEDGIRVTGPFVSRLDLWSTNGNTGSRNWTLRPDTVVYGDFSILQSNTRLGDPFGAGTSRLYIKNDGKVGIGTTSPTTTLHVAGSAKITADLTVDGNVAVTGNIAAKYQDVAEWVPASRAISAGTVVVLDIDQSNHVLPSAHAYDTRVAGVVSAKPGVLLGEGGEGKVMVATTGRVRVKVDATNAPIRVGDLLVASDKEGIAMRSQPLDLGGTPIHRPGTLIGKALEPLAKGVGEILVHKLGCPSVKTAQEGSGLTLLTFELVRTIASTPPCPEGSKSEEGSITSSLAGIIEERFSGSTIITSSSPACSSSRNPNFPKRSGISFKAATSRFSARRIAISASWCDKSF